MHEPLHFVVPRLNCAELDELCGKKLGSNFPYWLGGPINWPVQTYLRLREWRVGMSIAPEPKPGAINIAHVTAWHELGRRRGEYRVSVRADYRRVYDVDFEVLQNPEACQSPQQGYICYWPVPGILPREASRGELARLAYAGRPGARNLSALFDRDGFELRNGKRVEFVRIAKEQWHDMRQVDAVVAIRSFSREAYPDKPPSKLINAWHGRVPLIGGWDSAFASIGTPGEDYLRVASEEEFHAALEMLGDAQTYDRMVANGASKALAFTPERIAAQWLELIDARIVPHFRTHGASGPVMRMANRTLDQTRDLLGKLKRVLRA